MKAILATALLTAIAASSAHAEGLQFETRAFHSNLKVDGNKAKFTDADGATNTTDLRKAFYNTNGFGVAAVYGVSDALELGLGASLARYYPEEYLQLDQTVVNGFVRYNIVKSTGGKFYVQAGASDQMLSQDVDDRDTLSQTSNITPVANLDAGIGGAINLAGVDVGLEYKYSNSVGRGHATIKDSGSYTNEAGLVVVDRFKARITGIKLEAQEAALTIGVKL